MTSGFRKHGAGRHVDLFNVSIPSTRQGRKNDDQAEDDSLDLIELRRLEAEDRTPQSPTKSQDDVH